MTISRAKRQRIYERDGHRCVACGRTHGLTLQHIINKGMGGSKLYDGYSNLVTMCLVCNGRLERDAEFADLGRRCGWKRNRLGASLIPTGVVYYAWLRVWRRLDALGGYEPIDIPEPIETETL